MKVIFVDFNTDGHHEVYLKALIEACGDEAILVLPEHSDKFEQKQYSINELDRNMSFPEYRKCLKRINEIVIKEEPDIVHIVSGDFLYRFFGIGLGTIKARVLVTFHHMIFSTVRSISYRMIFRNICKGIVHTEYINSRLSEIGIKNSIKVEYPYFEEVMDIDRDSLRAKYKVSEDEKALLAFGGTRYDKGLDLLLIALNGVKEPFRLIVAGASEDFDEAFIREHSKGYKDRVISMLSYIEESVMEELFALCDIVVLPYRRKFAGASGPLTTGVANGKMIIGPDCNSVGDIITRNHLGYVFETENSASLGEVMEKAFRSSFEYDAVAMEYKGSISKAGFIDSYKEIYSGII